jgi:hypothetical protein
MFVREYSTVLWLLYYFLRVLRVLCLLLQVCGLFWVKFPFLHRLRTLIW